MGIEKQHDYLCALYGYDSWHVLYARLVEDVKNLSEVLGNMGGQIRLYANKEKSIKSRVLAEHANFYASEDS